MINRRVSIPIKSGLLASVTLLYLIPIEVWIIMRFPPEARTAWRIALVLSLGGAWCVLMSSLWSLHLVNHRTKRLTKVLESISKGDLRSELPVALDPDLVVVRDSLHRMRVAIDELTSRLRHIDSQRRRMFADLAHELATPTTTILGIVDTLARTDEDRARIAARLDEEAGRLARLIRDVRDLARLDDPDVGLEPRPTDVADLARRAAERVSLADTKRAPVSFTAAPTPEIEVDVDRIDQVLMNLLGNAKRYTPADGTIHVDVTPAPSGDGVRITVEDSGTGVPDEVLPRLGERLLRVDPTRSAKTGGSGLGLAIVSAVVHRHGGSLQFGKASLGGLRATIELPKQVNDPGTAPRL